MMTMLSFYNFIVKFINNSRRESKGTLTTVKEVWICDTRIIKFGGLAFALNFFRNYECFEKLYQTFPMFGHLMKHSSFSLIYYYMNCVSNNNNNCRL